MAARISNQTAEAARPREARFVIWDSELSGFGLRVAPTGARSWIASYRVGGGRKAAQRLMTLGTFPKVGAPAARSAASKVLAAAALGQDPAGERTAKRREMTIADLVDLYETDGCFVQRGIRQGEPMKPTTKAYTMARLRHHVVPLLGTKRVSEVTEADIERFSRDVARGKTAKDVKLGKRKRIIVRGGDGAARKVVRDLSALFSFARVPHNPVSTASVRKTDNRRERFLSLEEVKRLGAALEKVEAEGANPMAVNQARLWALTGCRRNEIAGLRWEEVDFERGLLILGDTKTGRSIRPLGAAAVALLKSIRAATEDDETFVFPAVRGDGFYQGAKRIWPEVVKKANLCGVTPHTLRHTLGSAAASAGEALLMVGSILGHANARSTQIYAHVAHDPARSAADRATRPLAEALGLRQ
jgi:integrase